MQVDDNRSVGRWVSGKWSVGRWSVGQWSVVLIKPVFQKILVESNCKPNTLRVDKSSEFNNRSMKSFLQNNNVSNLSIYTFFDIEVTYLYILFLKVLINLSVMTDFPSLCFECISILLFCENDFIYLLLNSLLLSTHVVLGLRLDSIKIF